MKHPYIYPHKSREDIIYYLVSHEHYRGWNHPTRGWSPFSWDVKVHRVDETGGWRTKESQAVDPFLNEYWEKHLRENPHLINVAFKNAYRYLLDGEYTTYPRDDQGDWKFCFGGRSGGHLILEKWRGINFLTKFKLDFEEWLKELDWKDLKALYKGIRCMDHDFTREKASHEVNYQLNFQRVLWEDDIRERGRRN